MFFAEKDFTEVDALFLQVGSSLGHPKGEDAWVVEVERKSANQQGDYYVAIQRARKFAELLGQQFRIRARAAVIYEDDSGKYSYPDLDSDVLLIPVGLLRDRTRGLRFPSLADIPGVASDKTSVKLALLRQLAAGDPNHPDWYAGPLSLGRDIHAEGLPLHLPIVGHQDTDRLPDTIATWLTKERETDVHLAERIDRYLAELHAKGQLDHRLPAPRLSVAGGQTVMKLLRAEREDPT
jgi:hypothetical protein